MTLSMEFAEDSAPDTSQAKQKIQQGARDTIQVLDRIAYSLRSSLHALSPSKNMDNDRAVLGQIIKNIDQIKTRVGVIAKGDQDKIAETFLGKDAAKALKEEGKKGKGGKEDLIKELNRLVEQLTKINDTEEKSGSSLEESYKNLSQRLDLIESVLKKIFELKQHQLIFEAEGDGRKILDQLKEQLEGLLKIVEKQISKDDILKKISNLTKSGGSIPNLLGRLTKQVKSILDSYTLDDSQKKNIVEMIKNAKEKNAIIPIRQEVERLSINMGERVNKEQDAQAIINLAQIRILLSYEQSELNKANDIFKREADVFKELKEKLEGLINKLKKDEPNPEEVYRSCEELKIFINQNIMQLKAEILKVIEIEQQITGQIEWVNNGFKGLKGK